MFTGISQEIGILKSKTANPDGSATVEISSKLKPAIGASVSVNGACLTVTKKTPSGFTADIIKETLKRTNLGEAKPNSKLNLEPSLRIGDELGGHFVSGHVDATCKLIKKETVKNGTIFTIELPKNLAKFVAEKGSITLNGVSLTICGVSHKSFDVAIIPFTLKNTNLGEMNVGDSVNMEVDLLARYIHNLK